LTSWSIRLADVRCFAQHLTHFDPLTEVPPSDAVPPARRTKPYIYSEIEIQALLAAALSLPPVGALRRWTYHCLFGLIAVTGLRHSEALGLLLADVDLDQGVLTIRETKFGKSRLVPLHATTIGVLSDYAARRDPHLCTPRSPYFFVAEQGGRLLHQYVHRVFWRLSRQIGLRLAQGAHVQCVGKGRNERSTPLTKVAQQALRRWLKEPGKRGATALFPNMHGGRLSADGVQALLNKYVAKAREHCVSLRSKRVSPHVLRHSAAMELLQAGVDCSVIALWPRSDGNDADLSSCASRTEGICTRKAEAVRTRQGRAISTKRPASGIPERPLSMRTMPSANQRRPAELAGNARFAANIRRDIRHSSPVGINSKTQWRRTAWLSRRRAHHNRQRPPQHPDR